MNDLMDEVYKMIKQRMVDAFILLYSKENDPIKQMLIDESMPFIVIGKLRPLDIDHQFTHIDNDNILASENLTRHVIEQGVDKLIFITEKGNFEVSKDEFKDLKRLHHNLIWTIKLLRLVMKEKLF